MENEMERRVRVQGLNAMQLWLVTWASIYLGAALGASSHRFGV